MEATCAAVCACVVTHSGVGCVRTQSTRSRYDRTATSTHPLAHFFLADSTRAALQNRMSMRYPAPPPFSPPALFAPLLLPLHVAVVFIPSSLAAPPLTLSLCPSVPLSLQVRDARPG